MAVEAPLHAERLGLIDLRHLVHRPMAAVAADAAIHVDCVVEVSVIGQAVDLHPGDRLARLPALADRSETRAVREDFPFTMTVDTGLGVREIGVAGHLDETMTVATIHAELLHVESVGKGNRLVRLIADARVLRGEVIPDTKGDGRTRDQPAHQELEREPIGPSGKEIRHRVV